MGLGYINKAIPAQLQKNLIAYYRLDGDTMDYSGNRYNPDLVRGITYTNGMVGLAAEFDGTNNRRIEIPGNPFVFTDGNGNDLPFSSSFWLYNRYKHGWILNKRENDSTKLEWQIVIYNNSFGIWIFSSHNDYISASIPFSSYLNQWVHITTTYDGSKSQNGFEIYINGQIQPITRGMGGNYTGMQDTGSKLDIGNPEWISIFNLNGLIQMVAIFDKELTPTEVMQNYQKQLNTFLK